MHQEIRLHGHLDESIEYFATAAARDVFQHRFYATEGETLRFFSPGSEIVLERCGIRHGGNGGSVCEYMFGVDQPLADLVKPEVRNRLVLNGAVSRSGGNLAFTDQAGGRQPFAQLFLEGNAVANTFFFISGSFQGHQREQQKEIARLLGRLLKRSPAVGEEDDALLASEILRLLGDRAMVCLVRLVHKKHRAYRDLFRTLYFDSKAIPEPEFQRLQTLAESSCIDPYQQERIRIDIMYKHPVNRPIVDEYRGLLIDCRRRGRIDPMENARLTRLKNLSVRNKIPTALFDTLDEMLKNESLVHLQEQNYLAEARQILERLLLQDGRIDAGPDSGDLVRLLEAKRRARENRDHTFEHILLEAGKSCDEKIRDGAGPLLLDGFSRILTFFDRFDAVADQINRLAFMTNVRLSEEMLAALLAHRPEFEKLSRGLFDRLFFAGILTNSYLGRYGRRKIEALQQGLDAIARGPLSLQDLLGKLLEIDREERLYFLVLASIKERMRNFYGTPAEQEGLRAEIGETLRQQGHLAEQIPSSLFGRVVIDLRKEALYLHSLLPRIVADNDYALREDFLANSGLDRFHIEELEREYFARQGLEEEKLENLRKL